MNVIIAGIYGMGNAKNSLSNVKIYIKSILFDAIQGRTGRQRIDRFASIEPPVKNIKSKKATIYNTLNNRYTATVILKSRVKINPAITKSHEKRTWMFDSNRSLLDEHSKTFKKYL
jgi:hypothetical protein